MAPNHGPNLRVLRPTRTKPRSGDIFTLQPADELYLFGQVVLADFYGPMPGCYLIYVYDLKASSPDVEPAELRPSRLLIPPVFINRRPWIEGYFQTIGHRDLGETVLAQHRFRDWDGRIVDEYGEPAAPINEESGVYALSSYRWLDDRISDALGVPRAPGDQ